MAALTRVPLGISVLFALVLFGALAARGQAHVLAHGSLVAPAEAVLQSVLQTQDGPLLDGKIQILWPHGGADVLSADRANITVYLFERGTLHPFCRSDVGIGLEGAVNNERTLYPAGPGSGSPRRVTQGNVSFIAWDFNDLDVSPARDPSNRLYFRVRDFINLRTPKLGVSYVHSNVWAHGANALTFYPIPAMPIATAPAPSPGLLPQLDPHILIVWPHDRAGNEATVSEADFVNVSATIFHHGTDMAVAPEYDRPVELYQALNQEPLRPVARGRKRLVTANGIAYPVWDFNDIDVSAARDPRNKYFFQVKTGSEWSNIWVHGMDGRTYFPSPDVPDRGCP